MKILQVVGYKNSGKTTLISRWTELLSECNKQVAVIKHHGHGGALEQPNVETDSMRYMQAGSTSSIVFDDQLIQLHMKQHPPSLTMAIEMAKLAAPEIILIEGEKQAHYPKVVLIRSVEDWKSLRSLENIVAVIIDEAVDDPEDIYDELGIHNKYEPDHDNSTGCPIIRLKRDDREKINEFLLHWLSK